jgi:hypothetical protein
MEVAAEVGDHLHHGPVGKDGLWKRAFPSDSLRINGYNIPHRDVISGKLGKKAPRTARSRGFYFPRKQQPPVPELSRPAVVKTREHAAGGSGPICQENGFPHDKDAEWDIRDLFQNFLDCRGPLQANRSRGWEQYQDAYRVRRLVELALKFRERFGIDEYQRGLSWGRMTGAESEVTGQKQGDKKNRCQDRKESFHFGTGPNQSASNPAMSCGNRNRSTSSPVAVQRRKTAKRFLFTAQLDAP